MDKDRLISALYLTSGLETVSFLVLLGAMFLHSEAGVSVAGAIHGLLFLAYTALVLYGRERLEWTWGFALVAVITGPIGATIVLERLRRQRRTVSA